MMMAMAAMTVAVIVAVIVAVRMAMVVRPGAMIEIMIVRVVAVIVGGHASDFCAS